MFVLQRDERGLLQSETPLYRVRIQIHKSDPTTGRGALCSVRFELPRLTLVQRFRKFITSQFKPI